MAVSAMFVYSGTHCVLRFRMFVRNERSPSTAIMDETSMPQKYTSCADDAFIGSPAVLLFRALSAAIGAIHATITLTVSSMARVFRGAILSRWIFYDPHGRHGFDRLRPLAQTL